MTGRRAVWRSLAAILLAAVALAACQGASPTSRPGGLTDGPVETTSSTDALPTLGPPPSPTPPDETSPVVVDPTVLAILPATVAGVTVTESIDEATQALGNPSLVRIASAVDAGVAADAASGNLVYAWVVRLRPGVLSDALYGQWRASYDEGACTGSGLIGPAEATIDGRTVYVTTCTQGPRTYHVWLKAQNILISASAVGQGNFGEQLLANLRVPS